MSAFNAHHDAVTALYTVPTLKKLLKAQPTIALPPGGIKRDLVALLLQHPSRIPRTVRAQMVPPLVLPGEAAQAPIVGPHPIDDAHPAQPAQAGSPAADIHVLVPPGEAPVDDHPVQGLLGAPVPAPHAVPAAVSPVVAPPAIAPAPYAVPAAISPVAAPPAVAPLPMPAAPQGPPPHAPQLPAPQWLYPGTPQVHPPHHAAPGGPAHAPFFAGQPPATPNFWAAPAIPDFWAAAQQPPPAPLHPPVAPPAPHLWPPAPLQYPAPPAVPPPHGESPLIAFLRLDLRFLHQETFDAALRGEFRIEKLGLLLRPGITLGVDHPQDPAAQALVMVRGTDGTVSLAPPSSSDPTKQTTQLVKAVRSFRLFTLAWTRLLQLSTAPLTDLVQVARVQAGFLGFLEDLANFSGGHNEHDVSTWRSLMHYLVSCWYGRPSIVTHPEQWARGTFNARGELQQIVGIPSFAAAPSRPLPHASFQSRHGPAGPSSTSAPHANPTHPPAGSAVALYTTRFGTSLLLRHHPDRLLAEHLVGAIRHGTLIAYDGPLLSHPPPPPRNLPMEPAAVTHLEAELAARVADGSLLVAVDPNPVVLSPIGAVPKDGSGWRTIHHLSFPRSKSAVSVNSGIPKPLVSFSYTTLDPLLESIRALLLTGSPVFLWKADIASAFRHCVVAKSVARLLGFCWNARVYLDTRLPFGCRSSPYIFDLYASAFHWILEQRGITLSHYLDDFFGCQSTPPDATLELFRSTASRLGFRVQERKVASGSCLEILGVLVDAGMNRASITPARLVRLRTDIKRLLARRTAGLREVQSITGVLQFVTTVVPLGRGFLRRLHDHCTRYLDTLSPRRLSAGALADLSWWYTILLDWPGTPILHPPRSTAEVWTDASTSHGLGGHLGPQNHPSAAWNARVPSHLRSPDIMTLEALAVLQSLRLWAPSLRGCEVTLHVDNRAYRYPRGTRPAPYLQRRPADLAARGRVLGAVPLSQPIPVPIPIAPPQAAGRRPAPPPQWYAQTLSSPAVAEFRWYGLAPSTRRSYAQLQAEYVRYCARWHPGAPPVPAPLPWVEAWLADGARERGFSGRKARLGLTALRSWHIDIGLSVEHLASLSLERTLKGIDNLAGPRPGKQANPITLPLLRAAVGAIRADPAGFGGHFNALNLIAAYTLAFAGFLRSGEFTYDAGLFDIAFDLAHLHFRDGEVASVLLPYSKTDPTHQGVLIALPRGVDPDVCPVRALRGLRAAYPAPPTAPLFSLAGGVHSFPRHLVVDLYLNRALRRAGFTQRFTGHSFRRGAATWAAAQGCTPANTQRLGRWKGDSFRRYIQHSPAENQTLVSSIYHSNPSPLAPLPGVVPPTA
ncbi:hypothetical protein B9479_008178, partial [Cryptococcus floricola]